MIADNVVGGHVAVAGMLGGAGGAGVLEIHAGEAVGVVADAEALVRGQVQSTLPRYTSLLSAFGIRGEVRLQHWRALL